MTLKERRKKVWVEWESSPDLLFRWSSLLELALIQSDDLLIGSCMSTWLKLIFMWSQGLLVVAEVIFLMSKFTLHFLTVCFSWVQLFFPNQVSHPVLCHANYIVLCWKYIPAYWHLFKPDDLLIGLDNCSHTLQQSYFYSSHDTN